MASRNLRSEGVAVEPGGEPAAAAAAASGVALWNAWIPLAPVLSHPLAVLEPASVDREGGEGDDVAPFHPGVPTDRTGLRWSARCG